MNINKINLNGTSYNIDGQVTSVVGETGAITAAQIASALGDGGYLSSGGVSSSDVTEAIYNELYGQTTKPSGASVITTQNLATQLSAYFATASNKPNYAYSEIGYEVATQSKSGAVTIDGSKPLHVVTCTGNISGVTLSTAPSEGHSCHVLFFATAARTVVIKHDTTNRVCPEAKDLSLSITANGYVEVDFLKANGKVYVRGV